MEKQVFFHTEMAIADRPVLSGFTLANFEGLFRTEKKPHRSGASPGSAPEGQLGGGPTKTRSLAGSRAAGSLFCECSEREKAPGESHLPGAFSYA
jgi:hypothetical protein